MYKALKNSNTKVGDFVVIPGAGGGLGHLGEPISLSDAYNHFMDACLSPFLLLSQPFNMRVQWVCA